MFYNQIGDVEYISETLRDQILQCLNWLQTHNNPYPHDGKYDLKDGLFANVMTYIPRQAIGRRFENHRKYIDVHFLISGAEKIFWMTNENDKLYDRVYDESTDSETAFLNGNMFNVINMNEKEYAIIMPGEWHLPGVETSSNSNLKIFKIVFKIPFSPNKFT